MTLSQVTNFIQQLCNPNKAAFSKTGRELKLGVSIEDLIK